jgi:hypothetical protein
VAMTVIPSKQPEMWASLSCLAVIVIALLIKRLGVRAGQPAA